MSTPAAKRRRIEAAASTLSKPFRSPFKSPLKGPSSLDSTRPITPATDESSSFVFSEQVPNTLVSPAVTPHRALGQHKTLPPSASIATQLNSDPDIEVLLRAQRELEKQLQEVKEQLEAAEQARKIERESRKTSVEGEIDGELISLIEKWRGASRQAAEELFGKVQDRVNRYRMGGPKAFKEMQKRQQEFHSRWDQEEQANIGSDEDDTGGSSSEKRDIYAEYSLDEETENEKSQRIRAGGDTTEMLGQEDEFTMAMMLRTLNVDLDIVGYDKVQQRWSD